VVLKVRDYKINYIFHYYAIYNTSCSKNIFLETPVVKEFEPGTTVSLSFDKQTCEPCIGGRDDSAVIIRNSEANIVVTSQLSR